MEDEKKKKRNKKKKNKQQEKPAAEDAVSNADKISSPGTHIAVEQSHLNQSVESIDDVGDKPSTNADDKGGHNAEAINGALSTDMEKQNWLQEEARLKDMVKQLLYEKDSHIRRQADLEIKLKQLQSENETWQQQEVIIEQKISELLQQQASLSSEKRDLEKKVRHIEKDRVSLVEKENSSREIIAALDKENRTLRMQVAELEGAKNNLSQENKQLIDKMSTLESQIQDLERSLASAQSSADAKKDVSEREDLNAEVEAACALVEKLVSENAELVEKVNELYMKLGSWDMAGDIASIAIPDNPTVLDPTSGPKDDISSSAGKAAKHFEKGPMVEQQQYDMDMDHTNNMAQHSSETTLYGEMVQMTLDENEAQELDPEPQCSSSTSEDSQGHGEGDGEGVPLTDAPLIGAPFRLVSFVAKYVSGADLVDKR